MIVAKFLNAAHNLVEQKDINEVVLGSSNSLNYVHTIICPEDPTKYDYIIIYMHAPGGGRNVMCVAKYYKGAWYQLSSPTVYRTISLLVSNSGTSLRLEVAEWLNSSSNNGVTIPAVVGVNRGGALAKILNWLAPRRKVVLAC